MKSAASKKSVKKGKNAAKKTTVKQSSPDPFQNAVSSLIQEQLFSLLDPNKPSTSGPQSRARLPSKRRFSDSDESSDEDGGGAGSCQTSSNTPVAKKTKVPEKPPQTPGKSYNAQVVLLDGVHDNLKTNPKKFLEALKSIKPELAIKYVRKTASGAMLVHPKEPKDSNSLLKKDAFAPNSILGPNVTARLPKEQTITHQVIIKNIDPEVTEDEVKQMLDLQEMPYKDVKRIWSRKNDAPSNMMRLILKDETKKKYLLKNGIYLDQMKFNCVQAKEDAEKKLAFQCWNCQKWNDHKTFECKAETKCVICAGAHRKSDCPKEKSDARCSNCDGAHPAWSTECPTYRAEIDKKKTFASATSDSVKTPSFLKETIEPIILAAMEKLKKQIAIVIAEVVAKAFLEHLFYESEFKRTNGEKYLGATARVTSIAKMATQSVNNSPLHESDNSTVEIEAVQKAVMQHLQSSMTVSKSPNSNANVSFSQKS